MILLIFLFQTSSNSFPLSNQFFDNTALVIANYLHETKNLEVVLESFKPKDGYIYSPLCQHLTDMLQASFVDARKRYSKKKRPKITTYYRDGLPVLRGNIRERKGIYELTLTLWQNQEKVKAWTGYFRLQESLERLRHKKE